MVSTVVTLPLQFNGTDYYLLVRPRALNDVMHYHVTTITESGPKLYGTLEFVKRGDIVKLSNGADFSHPGAIDVISAVISAYVKSSR